MAVYFGRPSDDVVTAETLPGGRAAQIVHVGSYDSMGQTYSRLMAWLAQQELSGGPVMWETYLTEPTSGGDQDTMLTRITWPLDG